MSRGSEHRHHVHSGSVAEFAGDTTGQGLRAVRISLFALAATALVQFGIYSFSGSVALFADLVHNLADALTAVPLWVAFRLGRRAANRRYTYGYGRAEDIAGIFIVALIAASAIAAGWESVQRLIEPRPVRGPVWVMAAGLAGFAGNELVAAYRIRVGRSIGSAALVADGLHARADGFTSLGVLVAGAAAALGASWADPAAGLAITAAILHMLKGAAREVYARLMDAVPEDLVEEAEKVLAGTPGVEEVQEVRLRWVGHRLRADAKIVVDCDRSFAEAHAIAEEAHHHLLHHMPVSDAVIHPNPCGHDGRDHHESIAHHFANR